VAILTLRRVLLLVNPASRRGARSRERARRAFAAAGVDCDLVVTERAGHAAVIAAAHGREYDAVFALGGDGTVMEVVGALSGTEIPVGVLPGGTGNLIARVLGIPLDVRKAVPLLLSGDAAAIDLGRIGDRRFAFAAGVGIDADMVERTPARLKRRLGVLAYVLTASKSALKRETFAVRAVVDGVVHERQATGVMIANFGAVFRNLITLGPGIRQDDGMLDLCVFSPRTIGDAIRVAWRLWRRDFRTDPCMLYAPGRHIEIETTPPRPFQADGDMLGRTPFEAHVEPLAAHLLIPHAG
jgi:diacylglycerol kinase (ATP)